METLLAIIGVTVLVGLGTWLRRRHVLRFMERHTRPDDADATDTFFGELGRTEVEGVFHGEDWNEFYAKSRPTPWTPENKNSVADPKQEG